MIEAAGDDAGVFAFEANLTLGRFERHRDALRAVREASGAAVFLAKILTDQEARIGGRTFSHFVKSGFTVEELALHHDLIAGAVDRGEIDGVTARIEFGESLPAAARRMHACNAQTGARILASLKLSGPGVATARTGDRETAARAAQAMVLSRCGPDVLYVFDTFMDVDRGYYPRDAFIDRRFNPRPAAGTFAAVASLFPEPEPFTLIEGRGEETIDFETPIEGRGEETIDFEHMGVRYRLVCAPSDAALAALATLAPDDGVRDLYTGGETTVSDVRANIARGTRGDRGVLQVMLAHSRS